MERHGQRLGGLLAAVALAFGCAAPSLPNGLSVRGSFYPLRGASVFAVPLAEIPTVAVAPQGTGSIVVALGRRGMRTAAVQEMAPADVLYYAITLIAATDGTPTDFNDNPQQGTTYLMAGNQAFSVQMDPGVTTDGNKMVRFVSVPNGTYRVRVQAVHDGDPTPDANTSPTGGLQDFSTNTTGQSLVNITKNDPTNTTGSGISNQADAIAVSTGTATITAGPQGAPPVLTVPVNLVDRKHDPVGVGMSVTNGNPTFPTIVGGNGNL